MSHPPSLASNLEVCRVTGSHDSDGDNDLSDTGAHPIFHSFT